LRRRDPVGIDLEQASLLALRSAASTADIGTRCVAEQPRRHAATQAQCVSMNSKASSPA